MGEITVKIASTRLARKTSTSLGRRILAVF